MTEPTRQPRSAGIATRVDVLSVEVNALREQVVAGLDRIERIQEVAVHTDRATVDQVAAVRTLVQVVGSLQQKMVDGNGKPGLLSRMDVIETHHEYVRQNIQGIVQQIAALSQKLDANQQRGELDSKENRGYVWAVALAGLSLLGALAQAAATYLFGK